jgi:hypothetical protein
VIETKMSAFPLLALPKCVALRSKHDNSYLRSVHHESHGGSLVELGHGDGGVMNPRARFYLEASKEHEGLIHVRSISPPFPKPSTMYYLSLCLVV